MAANGVSQGDLARLAADLMENEHLLNRRLLQLATTHFKRILKARQSALIAQALSPEDAERLYGEAIAKAIAAGLSKRIRRLARTAGIPIAQAEAEFGGVVSARAENAARAARAQAVFQATRAVEMGRQTLRPGPTVVRQLTDISNGGEGLVNENATRLENRPTDLGQDTIVQDVQTRIASGDTRIVTQYTWRRGDPTVPFEPHVVVNGRSWIQGENEENVLGTHPFNSSGNIYPGDHVGCQCEYEITFIEVSVATGDPVAV